MGKSLAYLKLQISVPDRVKVTDSMVVEVEEVVRIAINDLHQTLDSMISGVRFSMSLGGIRVFRHLRKKENEGDSGD